MRERENTEDRDMRERGLVAGEGSPTAALAGGDAQTEEREVREEREREKREKR